MRKNRLLDLGACLPFRFPDGGTKTYAAWPVWSDSTTKDVTFVPMPKKAAIRLYHRARDFDRQTNKPGHHGGALGHIALKVLETLIFDFLNFATGRLDPSQAAIARKANCCERAVASAIKRLRDLGILNWVRRCAESWKDGRFVLEQETNAYAVLPESQWRGGYRPPLEPPSQALEAGTWGDHPPLPSVMVQALTERKDGATLRSMVQTLASDTTDELAAALARLGRAMETAKS